jgi:hypothetical protein
MSRKVVALGATSAVLVAAVLVNLALLDLISSPELTSTLRTSLLVIGVSTLAIVGMMMMARLSRRPPAQEDAAKD